MDQSQILCVKKSLQNTQGQSKHEKGHEGLSNLSKYGPLRRNWFVGGVSIEQKSIEYTQDGVWVLRTKNLYSTKSDFKFKESRKYPGNVRRFTGWGVNFYRNSAVKNAPKQKQNMITCTSASSGIYNQGGSIPASCTNTPVFNEWYYLFTFWLQIPILVLVPKNDGCTGTCTKSMIDTVQQIWVLWVFSESKMSLSANTQNTHFCLYNAKSYFCYGFRQNTNLLCFFCPNKFLWRKQFWWAKFEIGGKYPVHCYFFIHENFASQNFVYVLTWSNSVDFVHISKVLYKKMKKQKMNISSNNIDLIATTAISLCTEENTTALFYIVCDAFCFNPGSSDEEIATIQQATSTQHHLLVNDDISWKEGDIVNEERSDACKDARGNAKLWAGE
jgi:hypothetical protein